MVHLNAQWGLLLAGELNPVAAAVNLAISMKMVVDDLKVN